MSIPKLRLAGSLSAAVYLLTLLFYIRGPQSQTRTAKELFAWFLSISLLLLFWCGYKYLKSFEDPSDFRRVVIFAAAFCLIAIFIYPFHSTDVFGYINRGWQQVGYNQNPYVLTVSSIPNWRQDPMIWDHWIHNPNPYGFLFTILTRALVQLGGGNWTLSLLLFKAVNALAYAASAWIIWSAGKHLGYARPLVALYAFLWNPLILMHHIANGHNDILMGCLLALSFYLAFKGMDVWIVPVLTAATLLKYAPAVLMPLALVFIIRRSGWRTAAMGCAIGMLIVFIVSAPYLQDWRLIRLEEIGDNATLVDNSLHSLLIHIYRNFARLIPLLSDFIPTVEAGIGRVLRVGFLLFLGYSYVRARKIETSNQLLEQSLLILFALICVASSKFNAWYMGILLPSALMLGEEHWLRRLILLITCAELLSLTFFKQAYMLNFFAMVLVPAWIVYRQVRKERQPAESDSGARSGGQLAAVS